MILASLPAAAPLLLSAVRWAVSRDQSLVVHRMASILGLLGTFALAAFCVWIRWFERTFSPYPSLEDDLALTVLL